MVVPAVTLSCLHGTLCGPPIEYQKADHANGRQQGNRKQPGKEYWPAMILGDGSTEIVEKHGSGIAKNIDDGNKEACVLASESNRKDTHGNVIGRRDCQPKKKDCHDGRGSSQAFRDDVQFP